jgi:hypothetical protein
VIQQYERYEQIQAQSPLKVPQPSTSGEVSLNFISINYAPIIGTSISATSINIATISVASGKNSHPCLFCH